MLSWCITGQKVHHFASSSASLLSSDFIPFPTSAATAGLPSFSCSFCGPSKQIVNFCSFPVFVFTSIDRFIQFSFPARAGAIKDAGWTLEILCLGRWMVSIFSELFNVGIWLVVVGMSWSLLACSPPSYSLLSALPFGLKLRSMNENSAWAHATLYGVVESFLFVRCVCTACQSNLQSKRRQDYKGE